MPSVYNQFALTAKRFSERPFLHIPSVALGGESCIDFTYNEMLLAVNSKQREYQHVGIKQGDRVALLLDNRAEFFIHWFALNSLGACVVPVNGELQVDEVAYLLDNSDACLAVSLPNKRKLLDQAAAKLRQPIQVVEEGDILTVDDIAHLTKKNIVWGESQPISAKTECAILYTSGSTGKPKGCVLSNEYFLSTGEFYRDVGGLCQLETGVERLITPLPLVHMNAMAMSTMGMIFSGGCIVQLDRFHPRTWWKTVRETQASVVHYLGVMPAILLNLPAQEGDDFSQQIKFAFGAGVNPKHHELFEKRFGFPLIEAWGMTETGGRNCILANEEPRHVGTSCIGKAKAHLEIKLVNNQGVEVPDGEPGELLVRSAGDDKRYGFFSGYYKNDAATKEAWEGGWLNTGDIVRQGSDGSYHFVDRIKNVIRRSGENISALEVEASLSLNPLIEQVAVTPVPDEIRGDEVFACVILKPDYQTNQETAMQLFGDVAKNLIYFKLPGYIAFVNEFPLTASNKPQRAELKRLARAMVESIDSFDHCFDLRALKKSDKKKTS